MPNLDNPLAPMCGHRDRRGDLQNESGGLLRVDITQRPQLRSERQSVDRARVKFAGVVPTLQCAIPW
eukprot:9471609-Pyramimonas_sp.AAC.1